LNNKTGTINKFKARKQQKAAINSNDTFANIAQIYKDQEEAKEKDAAWQRRHPLE